MRVGAAWPPAWPPGVRRPARRRSGWLNGEVRAQRGQTGLLLGTPWSCGWERGGLRGRRRGCLQSRNGGTPSRLGRACWAGGVRGSWQEPLPWAEHMPRRSYFGRIPCVGDRWDVGREGRQAGGRRCLATQGMGWAGAPASHSAGHGPPDPSGCSQSTRLWAGGGRPCRTTGLTGPFPHPPARVPGGVPPRCASCAPSPGRCAACGQGWVSF